MPVTIRPASHPPREWKAQTSTSAQDLLQRSCADQARQCKIVIQSSFADLGGDTNIAASSNGFLQAVREAYNRHHHLVIRPEDVWFAILTQLSFYINANAESLRSMFVAHEGQKELVAVDYATLCTADFGALAVHMVDKIDRNLVAKDLKAWIMPNFTTTTRTDTITAAVLMMGTMQKYFSYQMSMMCGIPSVRLLGERQDWAEIRRRLDRLPEFGEQTAQFYNLLVPILDFFLRTFDTPSGDPQVLDFWAKIAHRRGGGSGPEYFSGWINAFCFWSADGRLVNRGSRYTSDEDELHLGGVDDCSGGGGGFVTYGRVDIKDIPWGYVSVPVKVNDNGREISTRMVAGSVGISASSSAEKLDRSWSHRVWYPEPWPAGPDVEEFEPQMGGYGDGDDDGGSTGLDTLQPVSGWWMYEVLEG